MFEFSRLTPNAALGRSLFLSVVFAAVSGCGGEAAVNPGPPPQAGDAAPAGSGAAEAGSGGRDDAGTTGDSGQPEAGARAGSGGAGGSAGTAGDAGSGAAGTGGDQTAQTQGEEIAASLASAICDALRECVGSAKLAALTGREDCVARFSASLAQDDFGSLEQSVDSGSVKVNEAELEGCYDDTRALECDVVAQRLPESCQRALAGQRAVGDSCTLNVDCGAGLFCPISAECPRACEEVRPADEACLRDDECQAGLICHAHKCSEPADEGETCAGTDGAACKLGLSCVGSTDTDAGECRSNASVQAGTLGAVCTPGGTLCREGLSCAFDSGSEFKCVAAARAGETCKLALPSQCPLDSYCDSTEVTESGTCRALPVDGEACVLGDDCAPGHLCVTKDASSTCRRLGDLGDSCLADALCRSGVCSDDKCAVRASCE